MNTSSISQADRSQTAASTATRQPVAWQALRQDDAMGEIYENVLRISLVGVLLSSLLAGIVM